MGKKIKFVNNCGDEVHIPTVGAVGNGEVFEIDEEYAKELNLEKGNFKKTTKKPDKPIGDIPIETLPKENR